MRVEYIATQDYGDRISQERFLREDVDLLEAQRIHAYRALNFLLKLFEEAFLLEFLQKAHIDKILGLFAFCRGDALGNFLNGVANPFKIRSHAIVGDL